MLVEMADFYLFILTCWISKTKFLISSFVDILMTVNAVPVELH